MFTRRTVITFAKLERSFYKVPAGKTPYALCSHCQTEVTWLTPNQALAITRLTLREIFRNIETNKVHFIEDQSGLLFICANSISSIRHLKVTDSGREK